MLNTLITSKTRLRLLLKFFLNSNTTSYLRDLESEFGESSNAIRLELNRLEQAGILTSETQGNRKYFRANITHPLFCDLQNILRKYTGIDEVVERVVRKLGNVQSAWLTGSMARGLDEGIIDIILVSEHLDRTYLASLTEKAEQLIHRKIRYLVLTPAETPNFISRKEPCVLIWGNEEK